MPIELTNHNPVADAVAGKRSFPGLSADDYFEQFFNEANRLRAERLIISAEHFFGGQPRLWGIENPSEYEILYSQKIANLSRYLQGHEVSLIVYLRPQVDWLSSTVAQNIRISGLISDKPIYRDDRQFYEMLKPCLRYCELLDIWRTTLRPETVTVVPYVRERLVNMNSVSDFLTRLGFDPEVFSSVQRQRTVNASLSREFVEVKKILNRRARTKNDERVVIQCLKRLSQNSKFGTTYKLENDVVRDLEEFVAEDNRRLCVEYLNGGGSFTAKVGYRGDEVPVLTADQIANALEVFEQEYCRATMRLLSLSYAVKGVLRKYAPPVHAALHQVKRVYRFLRAIPR